MRWMNVFSADARLTAAYHANAASPQPTQQLSDIPASPLHERHGTESLRHLANETDTQTDKRTDRCIA